VSTFAIKYLWAVAIQRGLSKSQQKSEPPTERGKHLAYPARRKGTVDSGIAGMGHLDVMAVLLPDPGTPPRCARRNLMLDRELFGHVRARLRPAGGRAGVGHPPRQLRVPVLDISREVTK
jgi:hypothetical protein